MEIHKLKLTIHHPYHHLLVVSSVQLIRSLRYTISRYVLTANKYAKQSWRKWNNRQINLKYEQKIASNCICIYSLQLYEINDDPKRKEFLDDLFSFMQKRGEWIVLMGYLSNWLSIKWYTEKKTNERRNKNNTELDSTHEKQEASNYGRTSDTPELRRSDWGNVHRHFFIFQYFFNGIHY